MKLERTKYYLEILVFTVAAVIANLINIPIAMGIDLNVSQLFVLLVLYYYGFRWGITAALIVGISALFNSFSFYSILFNVLPVLVIYYLLFYKKLSLLISGTIYWGAIGSSFVFCYWYLVVGLNIDAVTFILITECNNAVFNVLLAVFIVSFVPVNKYFSVSVNSKEFSLDSLLLISFLSFVYFPILLLTIINTNSAVNEIKKDIYYDVEKTGQSSTAILSTWVDKYISLIEEFEKQYAKVDSVDIKEFSYKNTAVDFLAYYNITNQSYNFLINKYQFTKSDVENVYLEKPLTESSSNKLNYVLEFVKNVKNKKSTQFKIIIPVFTTNKIEGFIIGIVDCTELVQNLESLDSYFFVETNILESKKIILSTNPAASDSLQYFPKELYKGEIVLASNLFLNNKSISQKAKIFDWVNYTYVRLSDIQIMHYEVVTIGNFAPFINRIFTIYINNFSILLGLLIIAFYLSLYFARLLTSSLNELAFWANNFTQNHAVNFNEISKLKIAEVASLFSNFSKMNQTVNEHIELLSKHKEKLESDVAERTKELVELNSSLTKEIELRKTTEEKLLESKKLYQALSANIPDIDLYLFDKDLRFLVAEGSELKRQKNNNTAFEGKYILEVLGEEFFEKTQKVFLSAIYGEVAFVEIEQNGLYYNLKAIPILNEKGEVFAGLAILQNITKQISSLEEIKNSKERFEIVSKVSTDVIWDWDIYSNKIWVNDGYEKLFGFKQAELMNYEEMFSKRIHAEDQEKLDKSIHEAIEELYEIWEAEYRHQNNDGTYTLIHNKAYIIRKNNIAFRMIGGIDDITEKKTFETKINSLKVFYETILESINNGILVTDIEDHVIYINNAAAKIFGKYKDSFTGQKLFSVLSNGLSEFYVQQFAKVKQTMQSVYYESLKINFAENEAYYSGWIAPIIKNGNFGGMLCNLFDITSKIQSQNDLLKVNSYLNAIVESSPYSIFDINFSGVIQSIWNPASNRIFGWTKEEVIGKPMPINQKSKEDEFFRFVRSLETGISYNDLDFTKVRKDGSIITVKQTLVPIHNEKGVVEKIIIISEDITDNITKSQKLSESKQYAENLIEAASSPIIVWNSNYRITIFNKAFELLTGYTFKEVNGRSVSYLFPNESMVESSELIKKTNEGIALKDTEIPIMCKNGTKRLVQWNSAAITYQNSKKIAYTIAHGIDITDKKADEQKIIELNKNLEKKVAERTEELNNANKELEAFSYSVSHDLRAPLRTLDGFSQAVIEDYSDKIDDTGKDYLNRIRAAAKKMAKLIDDMLSFSRLSRREMSFSRVNISDLVEKILNETCQDENRKKQLIIQKDVFVIADYSLMEIALTNILTNAWKFTSNNEETIIEFKCNYESSKLIYTISDNGVGFEMKYANKLFAPFQRLHSDKEFPGTGIGLAIVQRVIKRHNGNVWIESEKNKGTTIYFTVNLEENNGSKIDFVG